MNILKVSTTENKNNLQYDFGQLQDRGRSVETGLMNTEHKKSAIGRSGGTISLLLRPGNLSILHGLNRHSRDDREVFACGAAWAIASVFWTSVQYHMGKAKR